MLDARLQSQHAQFIGLENYFKVFTDNYFLAALANTMKWIGIQCTFHTILGLGMALLLNKKPKGWKFYRSIGLLPCLIPNAALALIYLKIYNPQYGLFNFILGIKDFNWLGNSSTAFISLTMIWFLQWGVTTQILLNQIFNIDKSILEASRIDGATAMQSDFYIILPIIKKTIGTTMLLSTSYMLQMFDMIYLTTNGGPGNCTLNLSLYNYKVYFLENNYGYASTIGVSIIAIGAITSILIYRLIIKNN
jgi:raffinose/stachyose/melibiose transport system permease protein